MSTGFTGVFNSHIPQKPTDVRNTFPAFPLPSASTSTLVTTVQPNDDHEHATNFVLASLKAPVNNTRTAEEVEIIQYTANGFNCRLAADQQAVLQPDVDSSFVDEVDAINRLLPYHMFQQPKEDLIQHSKVKGKEKAAEEIEETRFALECFQRRRNILDRWRRVRSRSGKRAARDDQAYYLANVILEADRSETAWLTQELRNVRSEAERFEREKRLTTSSVRMSHFPSAQPQMVSGMQTQYYRAYPYAYAQAYGASPVSTPLVVSSPAPAGYSLPQTPATPTAYSPYTSTGAIPVQLPVASLPALHALGIVPVPANSLQEGQPQPAAVLRGSSANGAILNLEINVSLLQNTQMSGLAMVLNSLVARTHNTAAATAAAATAASSNLQQVSASSITHTNSK